MYKAVESNCYNIVMIVLTLLISGNASYFVILLCLMPDDFTRQGENAATQWVNIVLCSKLQMFLL